MYSVFRTLPFAADTHRGNNPNSPSAIADWSFASAGGDSPVDHRFFAAALAADGDETNDDRKDISASGAYVSPWGEHLEEKQTGETGWKKMEKAKGKGYRN